MILSKPKYNNDYEIVLIGDVNDGDYITAKTNLSMEELIKVEPILIKMVNAKDIMCPCENAYKELNWCTVEEFTFLENYVNIPYESQNAMGCHTIVSVEIYFYSRKDSIKYICNL